MRRASPRAAAVHGPEACDGLLLYDGDCSICQRCVAWLERTVKPRCRMQAWQEADLSALGVSTTQCQAAIQYVELDGTVHAAGAALRLLLRSGGTRWAALSRAAALPGIAQLVDAAYRFVARNRHRIRGGSACSLDAKSRTEQAADRQPPPPARNE